MPSVSPPVPSEHRRPQPTPSRPNLENQRKRARSLLKAARAGDAGALRRLAVLQPRRGKSVADPKNWSLHHAQLAIARELGFASWAKLKAHVDGDNLSLRFALVEAMNRALETESDKPLFVDPLARALAGKKGLSLHAELRSTTWPPYAAGPAPEQSIATRYFDDVLQAAVRDLSLTQAVQFDAGMDARAFRLGLRAKLAYFEVDDGAVFELKERVLRRRRAKPFCDRRIVRASLVSSWKEKLLSAGFDPLRPAAFLLPRLVYLDPATVERFFRDLRKIACAGSWLGAGFVSADTIASPFMKPFLEKLTVLGYPEWRFGVRDPEAFLAAHGWDAECVVAGDPEVSYGRWRYGYIPRTVPDRAIPRAYFAVACRPPGKGGAP